MPTHNHTGSATSKSLIGTFNNTSTTSESTATGVFTKAQTPTNLNADKNSYPATLFTFTGTHNHTVTISNAGSDSAHNNQQPYIVAYIWQRTA